MLTMNFLPPWQRAYGYEQMNDATRSRNMGFTGQGRRSHRRTTIASVKRVLEGIEFAYFEGFVRAKNNDGANKFIDYYMDSGGVQQGVVRIVDGRFDVATTGSVYTVTCDLEVFR